MHLDAQRVRSIHQRRRRDRDVFKCCVRDLAARRRRGGNRARGYALPRDFLAVEINHRAIVRQRAQRQLHRGRRPGKRELLLKIIRPRRVRRRSREHRADRSGQRRVFKSEHPISREPSARSRRISRRHPPAREAGAGVVVKPRVRQSEDRLHGTELRPEIIRARRAAAKRRRHPMLRLRPRQVPRAPRKAEARAVRADWPPVTIVVAQFIHHTVDPIPQSDRFAGVVERSRPRSQHATDSRARLQGRGIRCDDEIPARRNRRAAGKRKVHAARDPPAREIHVHRHLVVEFDPLGISHAGRVIHDLIENRGRIHRARGERERERERAKPSRDAGKSESNRGMSGRKHRRSSATPSACASRAERCQAAAAMRCQARARHRLRVRRSRIRRRCRCRG